MKVVAIVQARMGSTRLPGKVLLDLAGKSVLARVVGRLRRSTYIDEVVVATTRKSDDDAIVAECRRLDVAVFRGEEQDVLDRYYHAGLEAKAQVVARVTSDCPLIDPEITDKVIRSFLDQHPDYASNTQRRSYPRGLDTEVMTWDALSEAWRDAKENYERVHVTPYLYGHPERFRLLHMIGEHDYSEHRWTLDTPEDLELIRALYARVKDVESFSWRDVLSLLEREPWLAEINRNIVQKTLREC
jgi:spore coat polysaccharide biosynthesis protein SpsF